MAKPRRDYAVIGLGRFGSSLALALAQQGRSVLGLDVRLELVQRYADRLTQTVALDSTDENALRAVDIPAFDTVVVAIGSDFEANVITTVALKSLGVRRVISKALTERQRNILLRVGADRVISPEFDAGQRLAQELITPGLLDYLPLGPEHSVVELQAPAALFGQTLAQADLRRRLGLTVLAVKRAAVLIVSPPAEYVFNANDLLVVIGTNAHIAQLSEMV